ncbi:ZIP Zinc transporter [Pelomyxa schiedti]|nr:ZIP Zinc transporter [Pelomyxa schiedti]
MGLSTIILVKVLCAILLPLETALGALIPILIRRTAVSISKKSTSSAASPSSSSSMSPSSALAISLSIPKTPTSPPPPPSPSLTPLSASTSTSETNLVCPSSTPPPLALNSSYPAIPAIGTSTNTSTTTTTTTTTTSSPGSGTSEGSGATGHGDTTRLDTNRTVEVAMSLITAASAGVFFGVGLCHMADDAILELNSLGLKFPLALYLVIAGFSLMLAIEGAATADCSGGTTALQHHNKIPDVSSGIDYDEDSVGINDIEMNVLDQDSSQGEVNQGDHNRMSDDGNMSIPTATATTGRRRKGASVHSAKHEAREPRVEVQQAEDYSKERGHRKLFKAGALTLAMAVHAAVTGFALGLMPDLDDTIALAIACAAHEWSHSGALVTLFFNLKISFLAGSVLLVSFILVEPITLVVGIVVLLFKSEDSASLSSGVHHVTTIGVITGVMLGVGAGVFVYVGVFELLHEALESPGSKPLKMVLFFFFASGLAAIAAIEGAAS